MYYTTSKSTLVYLIDVQYGINVQVEKFLKKTLNVQDIIDVQGGNVFIKH